MNKKIKIFVSAEIIQRSRPNHSAKSFVGIALKEQVKKLPSTYVGVENVFMYHNQAKEVMIPLPKKAVDKVKAFDAGKKITPFWFMIELPDLVMARQK